MKEGSLLLPGVSSEKRELICFITLRVCSLPAQVETDHIVAAVGLEPNIGVGKVRALEVDSDFGASGLTSCRSAPNIWVRGCCLLL
uniref:Uncharacterized protein n=1 Tax=Sphaerodactylus townsendi TaxID=933632 RepID=A0ACB8FXX4_9SAUR